MKDPLGLESAVRKAGSFIKFRPRSAHEVRQRLAQKGFSPAVVVECLERLAGSGLLDDEKFARDWVAERAGSRFLGRRKVMAELARKGIERGLAESAAEEFYGGADEAGLALSFLKLKFRRGSRGQVRRDIADLLVRNGYSFGIADAAAGAFLSEQNAGVDGKEEG